MKKMYALIVCMTVCGASLFAQTTNQAGNAEAHFKQGVTYANQGDLDKAIAEYTEAIRLNPDYDIAYNYRGLAYRSKGSTTKPSRTSPRRYGSTPIMPKHTQTGGTPTVISMSRRTTRGTPPLKSILTAR